MHYQRSSSWGASKHLVKRFFNLFGDVTTQNGSLCSGSVMAAQKADMGARLGNDPQDFVHSKIILIWGRDPHKTGIHLIPLLKEARRRGATIILIDPIAYCDRHIPVRPGTDGFLAIGMAKELIRMNLVDRNFVDTCSTGYESYLSILNALSMEKIAAQCDVPLTVIKGKAVLKSTVGELQVVFHITDRIREDAIAVTHGTWIKHGGGVNQLTEDLVSTSGGMAGFYSTTVDIEPLVGEDTKQESNVKGHKTRESD